MKSALLLIAVLLFTACTSEPKPAFAGIDKNDTKEMKSLKISLFQYTEATISNDTEALLSFIYPPVFTIIPKEKMRQMLIKTFHSRDVPKIKDVKHSKIESIKKYDAGVYSIITSSMTTIIKSPEPKNQEFEEKMLTALQKQIGSRGTISLDKEKHLFNIRHTNKTIALNEKGSWKFIGFKQAQKYIKKGIFPLMLIDKLN
jgi:hypothetical protein